MSPRALSNQPSQASPEIDLLLASARVRMTPGTVKAMRAAIEKGIDWISMVQLAMRHGTMPLLYRNLMAVCPDRVDAAILQALRARFESQTAANRRRADELVSVLYLLRENGIAAIPYKGPALAQQIYRDLSLRGFGDLDVIVPEAKAVQARALLLNRGYASNWPREEDLARYIPENHEFQFSDDKRQLRLDLHWRFVNRYTHLPGDPDRFLQRFEKISLANHDVWSLSLEVYLLILSLHAAKHRWGQLKLICDIAEILQHPKVDWNYTLNEAKQLGLKRVLAVSVLLAHTTLHTNAPAELARGLEFDRAVRALAAEARASLFADSEEWGEEAPFDFQYKIRERLRDRARIYYCHELRPRLTPDERDRRLVSLPARLTAMYYVVRPMRMAWEKLGERP